MWLFTVGDRIHQLRKLVQGSHRFVVKVGTIDQLTDRALGGIEGIGQVVDLGQDGVQLLDRPLAGLDDVGEVWGLVGFELGVVLDRGTGGGLTVDVHDGVAENADGFQAGGGIRVHCGSILGSDLHRDLDRCELARRCDFYIGHGADRHPFQVDGSTVLQAGGILKIGAKGDLSAEDAACGSRHEEDESSQGYQRHDDQNAHLQL
jgi:hypothetical protein